MYSLRITTSENLCPHIFLGGNTTEKSFNFATLRTQNLVAEMVAEMVADWWQT